MIDQHVILLCKFSLLQQRKGLFFATLCAQLIGLMSVKFTVTLNTRVRVGLITLIIIISLVGSNEFYLYELTTKNKYSHFVRCYFRVITLSGHGE